MEVALVTKGKGKIQIVSPGDGASGHRGRKLRVTEGSVFYVPRNFGMCQMTLSSGDEPLEFVGFSTSSRPNHPQFLAGDFF
jgi:oxalate decarboxylase/phosphoglucose isomerase-like protein (cupin superfamily)